MSDVDDLIKRLSLGKIDPKAEERDRKIKLARTKMMMKPKEAPNPNDPQKRMELEKIAAMRRSTGRSATVLSRSNNLG